MSNQTFGKANGSANLLAAISRHHLCVSSARAHTHTLTHARRAGSLVGLHKLKPHHADTESARSVMEMITSANNAGFIDPAVRGSRQSGPDLLTPPPSNAKARPNCHSGLYLPLTSPRKHQPGHRGDRVRAVGPLNGGVPSLSLSAADETVTAQL